MIFSRLKKALRKRKDKQRKLNLDYEVDPSFNALYEQGLDATGTPELSANFQVKKRRARFYNTVQFFLQTAPLEGDIIECGCWKGLSSYIFCHYLKGEYPGFTGKGFTIVDSFEGLSEPTPKDAIGKGVTGEGLYAKEKHTFDSSMDGVKENLKQFPDIGYYKGWIPEVLGELPERQYKFVHIDVDLYDPILGSAEYFYPRLVSGGILLFDDYGSLAFPGAKLAVDEFCEKNAINLLRISTAQAVIFKK